MADSEGGSSIYLPASILISALILSATIFMVGGDVSKQISGLELAVPGPGSPSGNTGNTGNTGNVGNQPAEPQVFKIDLSSFPDDDAVQGEAGAKITIVEFSDFQCPFCKSFYNSAYQDIKSQYVDTGKARLIYRDLPLDITCNSGMGQQLHPQACKAAEAAECAADQGKFWEYHNKLFENQSSLSIENYKQWAEDLGLNAATFNACLDSGEKSAEIRGDIDDASALDFGGTPSFLIIFEKSGDNYNKVKGKIAELQSASRPDYFGFFEDSSNPNLFVAAVIGAQRIDTFKQVLDAGAS